MLRGNDDGGGCVGIHGSVGSLSVLEGHLSLALGRNRQMS